MALAPKINETIIRTEAQRNRAIFNAGYIACYKGFSNVDNPYTNCDGDAEAWNDGWFECVDDGSD